MTTYNVIPRNYYGFKHDVVEKKFEGNLHYINDFVFGEDSSEIWAVYENRKPNLKKGHKNFMILKSVEHSTEKNPIGVVGGVERDAIDANRYRLGVRCQICGGIVVSLHRYDFVYCGCKAVGVDGGRNLFRVASSLRCWDCVDVDLLNGTATLKTDKTDAAKRGLWHTIKTFLSNMNPWTDRG